jgi:two-component system sensor kinase FixL
MDEALSSAVLDAVIDPTMVIGEDGIITYFNRAACEAFLMEAEQAIGSNVSSLMANQADAANHGQYMENYRRTGQKKMIGRNRTVTAKRSDGSSWSASLSISEVTLESKRFFVGTLRDVTVSMERERLFSSVIDEAIDAIFTINEKALITLVNRSACSMFGYKEEELIGKNISMLMPAQHADRHDQYMEAHRTTGEKKMIGTDRTVTAKRRDNSEFKCRLGLSKINCTDQGGATFVGLLHDLTHELAAREADARAELANKMRKQKALFLASMSHEIRTPLNGIFGMLELLRSTELDEVQTEWLATCSRSAQSLTTILDDILLFSRADGGGIKLERLSFNMRDIVEDVVTILTSQTNDKTVDLVYTVSRNVPDQLIGDPTRLRQVMLIFLSNALKFTSIGHVALEVSVNGMDDEDSDDDSSTESLGNKTSDSTSDEKKEPEDESPVELKFEISDTGKSNRPVSHPNPNMISGHSHACYYYIPWWGFSNFRYRHEQETNKKTLSTIYSS